MSSKVSVLLIDDNYIDRLISTKILQSVGIANVVTAVHGQEALAMLNDLLSKKQPVPDLIFVDLNMPVLDGFGFIEGFKKLGLPDKIPIAIVTSSSDPKDIRRANELGVMHFLTKPITEASVRDLVT